MECYYVALEIILVGIIALGIFLLGALFMKRIMENAYAYAMYAQRREEYYRLAGYRQPGDPKPYVPPMAN